MDKIMKDIKSGKGLPPLRESNEYIPEPGIERVGLSKKKSKVRAAVKALQDSAVEFELFGICSDYVPLDTAIDIVIKLGAGK